MIDEWTEADETAALQLITDRMLLKSWLGHDP
jgi:hypothetical protein